MQNFILVLSTTILSILPNNLSANDIPISRGDVYIHEISKNDYDNKKIQGWLVYPPNFDSSKKYPLVLEIHGGPFTNYGFRFTAV